MPWTVYGIIAVFALFVVLMIVNPKLSCFGKRVSSPLYPILRKRKQKEIKTEDYGFHLVDPEARPERKDISLDEKILLSQKNAPKKPEKAIKAHDYGFHLVDEKEKKKNKEKESGPD